MADRGKDKARRPQPCDRGRDDDLQGPAGPARSATIGAARRRAPSMTTARPSRSAGSTWSPIPAPMSTCPSTASPRATISPRSAWSGWRRWTAWCVRSEAMAADAEAVRGAGRRAARRCWSTPAGTGTGAPRPISSDHPSSPRPRRACSSSAARALVGIDSHNIDDTRVRTRPVHTALLGAGMPICEHMTNLGALPDERLPLHRRAAQGRRAWAPSRSGRSRRSADPRSGYGFPVERAKPRPLSARVAQREQGLAASLARSGVRSGRPDACQASAAASQSGTIASPRSSTRRCSTARPSSG